MLNQAAVYGLAPRADQACADGLLLNGLPNSLISREVFAVEATRKHKAHLVCLVCPPPVVLDVLDDITCLFPER